MKFWDWVRLIFTRVQPPPREVRLVPWLDAGAMLKSGWRLAPEEDSNRQIGTVYLERSAT